jgi:hypothetical protein
MVRKVSEDLMPELPIAQLDIDVQHRGRILMEDVADELMT